MKWQPIMLIAAIMTVGYNQARELSPQEVNTLAAKQKIGMERYPIGFWNYSFLNNPEHLAHQQQSDVEQWRDAGFTMAMSPFFSEANPQELAHLQRLLDWAQACDIKVLSASGGGIMPEGMDAEAYRSYFRESLQKIGNHPALLGFIVGDEPPAALTARITESCRLQREEAPDLLPFLNLYPWLPETEAAVAATDGWSAYLDSMIVAGNLKVLCYDYYGQLMDEAGIEGYFKNLWTYREAAMKREIPFWTTLGSVGHWSFRVPSRDDLRWQFNTAVCAGAGGVMWFMYYIRQPEGNFRMAPVDEFWETTQTYDDLRYVHRSFEKRYGNLFNRLLSTQAMCFPQARGGFPEFTPGTLLRDIAIIGSMKSANPEPHSAMIGEFIDASGEEYLMVVNSAQGQQTRYRLELAGPLANWRRFNWQGIEEVIPPWESATLPNGNIELTLWLSPGQEFVWHRLAAQSE